jgi:hypothetical protein
MSNTAANTANQVYTTVELGSKTQKQLIAIASDLGQLVTPAEGKKLKNAGLIELVLSLQSVADLTVESNRTKMVTIALGPKYAEVVYQIASYHETMESWQDLITRFDRLFTSEEVDRATP